MKFRPANIVLLLVVGVFVPGLAWSEDSPSPQRPQASSQEAKPQPSSKPGEPAPATLTETSNPPSVTVIEPVNAQGILGRDVHGPTDEDMGRIADVIVDKTGQVRAAVIDFGGFLGVGSRKIVVDWNALHFGKVAKKGESVTLELSRDQVKAAPEYKDGAPIIVLGSSGSLEPLQFPSSAEH